MKAFDEIIFEVFNHNIFVWHYIIENTIITFLGNFPFEIIIIKLIIFNSLMIFFYLFFLFNFLKLIIK